MYVQKLDRLTPDRSDLAASFFARSLSLARRFAAHHPHLADELESGAGFGCVEAAEGYDPATGHKFTTYAHAMVVGRLRRVVRDAGAWHRRRRDLDLDRVPGSPAVEPASVAGEAFDALAGMVHGRDRQILIRIYREGQTQREIAASWGIWQSNVKRGHQRALNRLRERVRPS